MGSVTKSMLISRPLVDHFWIINQIPENVYFLNEYLRWQMAKSFLDKRLRERLQDIIINPGSSLRSKPLPALLSFK